MSAHGEASFICSSISKEFASHLQSSSTVRIVSTVFVYSILHNFQRVRIASTVFVYSSHRIYSLRLQYTSSWHQEVYKAGSLQNLPKYSKTWKDSNGFIKHQTSSTLSPLNTMTSPLKRESSSSKGIYGTHLHQQPRLLQQSQQQQPHQHQGISFLICGRHRRPTSTTTTSEV